MQPNEPRAQGGHRLLSYTYDGVNWIDVQERNDSIDAVIENNNDEISENTPLLDYPRRRSLLSSTLVILVSSILLIGVCISVYLIVLQFRFDNMLPPIVDDALEINKSGLPNTYKLLTLPPQQSNAKRLLITQTKTDQCDNEAACVKLLQEMQEKSGGENAIYYNFLVSSNGQIYVPVNIKPSPLIQQDLSSTITIAFIGDYTNTYPSGAQVNKLKYLLDNSMSKKDWDVMYRID